jgi:hypothetical protein
VTCLSGLSLNAVPKGPKRWIARQKKGVEPKHGVPPERNQIIDDRHLTHLICWREVREIICTVKEAAKVLAGAATQRSILSTPVHDSSRRDMVFCSSIRHH